MIINSIKKRRSFRTYKVDPVSDELVSEIIKAAQFAPTAMGRKAVEFVVIKNQETKNAIFEVIDQEYIKTAPVLVAPVASDQSVLPVQDLSIASENIFLQAAELGLGSVWKNLMPGWEEKVKEILGVPQNFRMINIIPIGFPAEEKSAHGDEEFKVEKIHQEKW
jgi:nitroreductase